MERDGYWIGLASEPAFFNQPVSDILPSGFRRLMTQVLPPERSRHHADRWLIGQGKTALDERLLRTDLVTLSVPAFAGTTTRLSSNALVSRAWLR